MDREPAGRPRNWRADERVAGILIPSGPSVNSPVMSGATLSRLVISGSFVFALLLPERRNRWPFRFNLIRGGRGADPGRGFTSIGPGI